LAQTDHYGSVLDCPARNDLLVGGSREETVGFHSEMHDLYFFRRCTEATDGFSDVVSVARYEIGMTQHGPYQRGFAPLLARDENVRSPRGYDKWSDTRDQAEQAVRPRIMGVYDVGTNAADDFPDAQRLACKLESPPLAPAESLKVNPFMRWVGAVREGEPLRFVPAVRKKADRSVAVHRIAGREEAESHRRTSFR